MVRPTNTKYSPKEAIESAKRRRRHDKERKRAARKEQGNTTAEQFIRLENKFNLDKAIKQGQSLTEFSQDSLKLKTGDLNAIIIDLCTEGNMPALHKAHDEKMSETNAIQLIQNFTAILSANLDQIQNTHLAKVFDSIQQNVPELKTEEGLEAILNLYGILEDLCHDNRLSRILTKSSAIKIILSLACIERNENHLTGSCFLTTLNNVIEANASDLTFPEVTQILPALRSIDLKPLGLERIVELCLETLNKFDLDNQTIAICEDFLTKQPQFTRKLDINKISKNINAGSHNLNWASRSLFQIACHQLAYNNFDHTVSDFLPFNKLGIEHTPSAQHLSSCSKYLKAIRKIVQYAQNHPRRIGQLGLKQHQANIHKLLDQIEAAKYTDTTKTRIAAVRIYQELSIIEYLLQKLNTLESKFDIPVQLNQLAEIAIAKGIKSSLEIRVHRQFVHSLANNMISLEDCTIEAKGLSYSGFACDIKCVLNNGKEVHLEVDGIGHHDNSSVDDELRDRFFEEKLNIPVVRIKFNQHCPSDDEINYKLKQSGIYELLQDLNH